MRRHSLAAAGAGSDEVCADDSVCHEIDWTDEVDNVPEMAQLVTDEFWEIFSVRRGRTDQTTTKLRDRADEAD